MAKKKPTTNSTAANARKAQAAARAARTPAEGTTAKPDKPTTPEAETSAAPKPAAPETKPAPSPVPEAPKAETPEGLRVYSVCCPGTLLGTKLVKAHNANEAFEAYVGDCSGFKSASQPVIDLCPDLDPTDPDVIAKLSN